MIKCVENRIWELNAKIINTDADCSEINQQLSEAITEGIFSNGNILFSYSSNQIGNYSSRAAEITLELNSTGLSLYQKMLNEKSISLSVSSFRMVINTFGFLNIIPVFEYTGNTSPAAVTAIEPSCDSASEIIDSIFSDISLLIDTLDKLKIIQKSDFYHFGVPSDIEKYQLHTKDDSYNYTLHFFFVNESESLKSIVSSYQVENNVMNYGDLQLYYTFPL